MLELNQVEYGNNESLQSFLLENALQHTRFKTVLAENGLVTPSFNLFDLQTDNIDDWMLPHQNEHQAFAQLLGLQNPINLLDMNWNDENQFYDWISDHYFAHVAVANALGVT